ncbi:MAG TPA: aldehyde dehydrogenase family protein, partial [Longimicrobium sp.]|nr:aldehyde dehydrogenase family protein [Longimicrobium sp.]
MPIATINPATGETLRTFDALTAEQVEEKLQRASDAFLRHRRTSIAQRAEKMRRAGELLDAEKERWARLMTTEMGKTLGAARAEAEKCAWVCRHYAEHAEAMLAPRPVDV